MSRTSDSRTAGESRQDLAVGCHQRARRPRPPGSRTSARTTCGTQPRACSASGANVEAVRWMLGHASAAMTLDVYSRLFDDDLGALAERMDAAHDAHESLQTVGPVWAPDEISDLDDASAPN